MPDTSAPPQSPHATPMYASFLTFTTLLDWLKEMDVIPSQIDRSLWGTKFSGSSGAQLFSGCRFLGLMDGEQPRDRLLDLAKADTAQRKRLLVEVLRDAYGASLTDGLASMTPRMLDDALRQLGTTETTHRKATAFLINAAKFAEIPLPGAIARRARNRPARNGATGRRRSGGSTSKADAFAVDRPSSQESAAVAAGGDTRVLSLESGAVITLSSSIGLMRLPPEEREFAVRLLDLMDEYERELTALETEDGDHDFDA